MSLLRPVGSLPAAGETGYLPFPAAVAAGIFSPEDLCPNPPQAAADEVLRGLIPDNAGLVDLGRGRVAAYDLTASIPISGGLELPPTTKRVVHPGSRVVLGEGVISLVFDTGLVRPVAIAQEVSQAEWASCVTDRRRPHGRRPGSAARLGKIVVQRIPFGDYPDYEIDGITEAGGLRVVPRAIIL